MKLAIYKNSCDVTFDILIFTLKFLMSNNSYIKKGNLNYDHRNLKMQHEISF
jgi:hypothetical protein